MVEKLEKLKQILNELGGGPSVVGTLVVSRGGLVIASNLERDIHEETFAAMSATMVGATTAALAEYDRPAPEVFYVTGGGFGLVALTAGEKAILVCMISDPAQMQEVGIKMNEVREEIEELVR